MTAENMDGAADLVLVDVQACARCGQDHPQHGFRPFRRSVTLPDHASLTHWGICPETAEPILLLITGDDA